MLNLREPVPDLPGAALRRGLAERLALFLSGQFLDIPSLKRATAVFGPLLRVPYIAPSPEDPDVVAVLKEVDEQRLSAFGRSEAHTSDLQSLMRISYAGFRLKKKIDSHTLRQRLYVLAIQYHGQLSRYLTRSVAK